jgi:predicted DNA-binding protein (MmcQ/YjbR family)
MTMITTQAFRKLAMSFPEALEQPHFHRTSFRVKKKIFATLDEREKRVVVKFSPVEQSVFIDAGKGTIYPVPGGWGRSGFTYVDLATVKKSMLADAVTASYRNVAPGKLSDALKQKG